MGAASASARFALGAHRRHGRVPRRVDAGHRHGGVRPSFGLRQYWSSGVVFFGQPGEAALLGLRRFRHRAWDGHDGLHGLGSLLYAGGTGQDGGLNWFDDPDAGAFQRCAAQPHLLNHAGLESGVVRGGHLLQRPPPPRQSRRQVRLRRAGCFLVAKLPSAGRGGGYRSLGAEQTLVAASARLPAEGAQRPGREGDRDAALTRLRRLCHRRHDRARARDARAGAVAVWHR
mmetsp:Transcript_6356/g.20909  ORF Transcript_6356/g.20909 Transcript_6356/m.20909 type:complete len:230 (-) Transcript_6356:668-1357(-)